MKNQIFNVTVYLQYCSVFNESENINRLVLLKKILIKDRTMKIIANHYVSSFFIMLVLSACEGRVDQQEAVIESKFIATTSVNEGGSISPLMMEVQSGEGTQFTVKPGDGFKINNVIGCNGKLEGSTYTTRDITENCQIDVSFSVIPPVNFMIQATAGTGGSVNQESVSVLQGEITSFTVTVDKGFAINHVSGCNGSLNGNIYTTGEITTICNVVASFDLIPPVNYLVTATAGVGGSVSSASTTVQDGASTSFTVTADNGFTVSQVSGCNGSLNGNIYTTGAITANCSVVSSFDLIPPVNYMVTATAGTGGDFNSISATVQQGASTTFSVIANNGFTVNQVSGCNGSLNGNIYTTGTIIADCSVDASFIAVASSAMAVINPSRTSCIAPCSVMFSTTGTVFPGISDPFTELNYSWNYGDVGVTFNNRSGIDANKSTSPIGAHAFANPGTYQVVLTASSNNGDTAIQTVTITVEDPDVYFANRTYCVSNQNSFTACPNQNSAFHINSHSAISNLLTNMRFNQPILRTRVLFRAGEVFDVSAGTTIRGFAVPLLISSYGTGINPVLQINDASPSITLGSSIFFIRDSSNVIFSGLDFKGNYDPVNGTGKHITGIYMSQASSDITIYNNDFTGLGLVIYAHGGSSSAGIKSQYNMIVDNKISDWQDYGVFGNFGYLGALLANSVKQNPAAVSGSESKCGNCLPNYPDHGPIRTSASNHLLIQYNDMFNNAGWSSGGLAHQPNIRLGTGGIALKSVVSDNTLNGGFTMLSMTPANSTASSAAIQADVIIERNQFTASSNTWQMIDMGLGGATIRNNLFLKPDNAAPPIGSGSFQSAIVYKVANTTPENLTYRNKIYNNTLISLAQSSAPNLSILNVVSISSTGINSVVNEFTLFDVHNNLLYMPFVSNGGDSGLISWQNNVTSMNGVVSDNNLVYAPNNQNFVWDNGQSYDLAAWQLMNGQGNSSISTVLDPLLVDPNNFDAHLQQASPAINSGKLVPGLVSDYIKRTHTGAIDIGAYEMP
jgi:hypothetical protein